jgi:aminoglycoside 3-N-acetyltransferase
VAAVEVSEDDIRSGLEALGVGRGDTVLVHSSLSSFGHVEGGAGAVIDALAAAVGTDGTVAVPTHTWHSICADNPVFDVREMPSEVGRITEVFRRRPRALRSLHPTHSCAALGPRAEVLLRDHEKDITPCGPRSPYQRIIRWGGKLVFLGVTLFVNTSFHALEEMACVPWAFNRFELLYTIDYEGKKRPVPSRRHTNGLRRAFEELEPVLAEGGALQKGRIGEADIRVVRADRMATVLLPMLAEDPFLFLAPGGAALERERYERWRHGGK